MKGNVQFIIISVSALDTIETIKKIRNTYQITTTLINKDGGSLTSTLQFIFARYGPYQNVPQFSIILPDGSVIYDIVISRLEERVKDVLTAINSMPIKSYLLYSFGEKSDYTCQRNILFEISTRFNL